MGKHNTKVGTTSPTTGDGRKGGRKPPKTQVTVRTSGGAILWKATASLFRKSR